MGGMGEGGAGGMPPGPAVSASPVGGPFDPSVEVTLTSDDPSATIYYTTDLSEVDESSNEYDGPITLTETTVLKFRAGVSVGAGGGGGSSTVLSQQQAEGYVLATNDIRDQWARSGHGSIADDAWRHWDEDGEVSSSCAKCHSAEGFLEYAATGANVAAAPLPVGLDCVGCHQQFPTIFDYPASYPFLDPVEFPSGAELSLHDRSNLCMTCHQGRESGKNVEDEIADDGGMGPYTFINIHYYPAAATNFGSEAYGAVHYPDKDYRPRNTFPSHPESFSTCLGCHMTNAEDSEPHTWVPDLASCQSCHGGDSLETLGGSPSQSKANIDALADELYAEIQSYATDEIGVGIFYDSGAYPYFFKEGGPAAFPNRYDQFDATLLRAAYNFQASQKDPFGYIHNGTYIQQYVYDSIEDLGGTPSVAVIGRGDLTIDGSAIGTASKTQQWQISGHGAADGEPFRHWDEDDPPEVSGRCSRCHTTPGYVEWAGDNETTAHFPNTTVDCWSCHSNFNLYADASTRYDNLGDNPALEPVDFPSGFTATYTGVAGTNAASNICMGCHQGRSSGQDVDDEINSDPGPYTFINIHYYPAGATLWGSEVNGGYEYAGETYRGRNVFGVHTNLPDSEILVDCVGCHMNADENQSAKHTFLPKVADCNACHAGSSFESLAGSPRTNFNEIETMLDELYAEIQDYASNVIGVGIFYDSSAYPYFFKEGGGATFGNRYDQFDDKLLRAAYNYQVGLKDPGGYIHNGVYLKQIFFDSIADLGGASSVPRP
jgi:hypothetical protein